MTDASLSESTVEVVALDWLRSLGWTVLHGPDIAPDTPAAERDDYDDVVLHSRLRTALARLNPGLPNDALDDAHRRLTRPAGATLDARHDLHRMLVAGVTVEYAGADGRVRGDQVRVLDLDEPERNDWLAVNQFTVVENRHERRPDIVLFVNGLPLAVIELKNPADENATINTAFTQLQTYKSEIPSLFAFNAALVVSDGLEAHFLIVWDCDAESTAKKLAKEIGDSSKVTAFAFDRRSNSLASKGIENKYEENLLLSYSKIVLDGATGKETNRSFDNRKKTAFADYVAEHGTVADFVHFDDLRKTVEGILDMLQVDR